MNHLGNILNQRLDDDDDLRKKKGHFIGSDNNFFSNFANVQSAVLTTCFKRYCCSFYGCTLWKLNKMCTNNICTSWNKAIRKVWKLPQIVICFIRFSNRLVSSANSIVSFIARVSMSNRIIFGVIYYILSGNMMLILQLLISNNV